MTTARFPGRRNQVLEAAIAVLAHSGSAGLTYRSVDETAQVPTGTTVNYFRPRDTLLTTVCCEIANRRCQHWHSLANVRPPCTQAGVVDLISQHIVDPLRTTDAPIEAYLSVLIEAQYRPTVLKVVTEDRQLQAELITKLLRHVNSPTPQSHAEIVVDHLTAITLRQALSQHSLDPKQSLSALLAVLVPPDVTCTYDEQGEPTALTAIPDTDSQLKHPI